MEEPGWRERLRYGFDSWMSRGTGASMALLGLATIAFVVVMAVAVVIFRAFPGDDPEGDFWDIVWGNLMRTLDPGTMGGDAGWGFRLLMLVVTVGGLILVASLIGIVSGGFDDKMVQLRKGRSRVLERDHTLILGWGGQLFPILAELCIANASRGRSAVVVLADADKVEMEEEIRAHVPDTGSTAIICRRGDPMSPIDLQLGNPQAARSVIVLTQDATNPDAAAIKTVLALTNGLAEDASSPNIVAELRDPRNLDAAKLVGRGCTHWVLAGELINRMTVQTCRQSGLSTVYTELLDFAGDEIYFSEQPQLAGLTYLDAQLAFADSTVIGLERGGAVTLNPRADTRVGVGDRLILIAEDDSTIRPAAPGTVDASVMSTAVAPPVHPERTLVLGYNASLQAMLEELAQYLPEGSTACVVADGRLPDLSSPPGLAVDVRKADTTSRKVLDGLGVADYDHILVLAYRDRLDPQAADAKTLVTLLHLRDIADRADVHLNIVSEMVDDRNRELAEITRADDFIVSDRLVSLLLSQLSEDENLGAVFDLMFSSEGSEVYLRPAELYIEPTAEADFYTVAAAAARRGETAIGYRISSEAYDRSRSYGVHLNPPKAERRTFGPGDAVIVLAEDEG